MNHNFLPNEIKRTLKSEYRIRVTVVALFIFSFIILAGVICLFPTLLKVVNERNVAAKDATEERVKESSSNLTVLKQALGVGNIYADSISGVMTYPRLSFIVLKIISIKGDIMIHSIVVNRVSISTVGVIIQGNAPQRDDLVSFKASLDKTFIGSNSVLPISELAAPGNLDFSLQVNNIKP
jgi:hypothetical protein